MAKSKVTFIPAPYTLRKPINGGCQCNWCKAHPNTTPAWDTIATDGKQSWVVHFPELEGKQRTIVKGAA